MEPYVGIIINIISLVVGFAVLYAKLAVKIGKLEEGRSTDMEKIKLYIEQALTGLKASLDLRIDNAEKDIQRLSIVLEQVYEKTFNRRMKG